MKLKDVEASFKDQSQKASEIVRTLCLGGLAIIWLFKLEIDKKFFMDANLILPCFLFMLGLAFDLLHAVSNSAVRYFFLESKRKQDKKPDDEVMWNKLLDYPAILFFSLKIVAVFLGYIFLLIYLGEKLIIPLIDDSAVPSL